LKVQKENESMAGGPATKTQFKFGKQGPGGDQTLGEKLQRGRWQDWRGGPEVG